MARPIIGDEPLKTVVRFRVTESERAMLADLVPSGQISAYFRAHINAEHARLHQGPGDSVEQN